MKDAILTGLGVLGAVLVPVAIIAIIYLAVTPGLKRQAAERDCANVGRCLEAGGDLLQCHLQYPKCRDSEGS